MPRISLVDVDVLIDLVQNSDLDLVTAPQMKRTIWEEISKQYCKETGVELPIKMLQDKMKNLKFTSKANGGKIKVTTARLNSDGDVDEGIAESTRKQRSDVMGKVLKESGLSFDDFYDDIVDDPDYKEPSSGRAIGVDGDSSSFVLHGVRNGKRPREPEAFDRGLQEHNLRMKRLQLQMHHEQQLFKQEMEIKRLQQDKLKLEISLLKNQS